MKVMCKNRIAKKEHSEYIRAESKILQSLRHSFIVTLRFSFQVRSTAHTEFLKAISITDLSTASLEDSF